MPLTVSDNNLQVLRIGHEVAFGEGRSPDAIEEGWDREGIQGADRREV